LVDATVLGAVCCRFESCLGYNAAEGVQLLASRDWVPISEIQSGPGRSRTCRRRERQGRCPSYSVGRGALIFTQVDDVGSIPISGTGLSKLGCAECKSASHVSSRRKGLG
jgi:hypothetical protein